MVFARRALTSADQGWVAAFIQQAWHAEMVVAHGQLYHPAALPGFAALQDQTPIGLLTYQIVDQACEVVTLDSLIEGQGVGTALLEAVQAAARAVGCRRLWLITTNDNLTALRFYQKRGFRLVALHRGAVDRARQLKPSLPLVGEHGIPLHDELELEIVW